MLASSIRRPSVRVYVVGEGEPLKRVCLDNQAQSFDP